MDPLRRFALLAALALGGLPVVQAGEASAPSHGSVLTLQQCIGAAYGKSPSLAAEQFDVNAAGDEIVHQRSALLPSVGASVFGGLIDGYPLSLSAVTGQGPDNSQGGGLVHTAIRRAGVTNQSLTRDTFRANFAPYGIQRIELDYALFQNGSILGLNDAPAIAAARASKEGLEWTRKLGAEKVVFDLCNAFFIAQWFQMKVARDEARVHFSRQRVEIVDSLFGLQLKLQQDVQLARAALKADEQLLTSTKQSVRDTYAILALLTGRPASPVLKLAPGRPKFTSLPPLQELLRLAREQHPNVGIQRSVADYALAKLRLDKAQLLPQATFNTSYAVGENFTQISNTSTDTPTRFASSIAISVPVWDWGSRRAEVRSSENKVRAEELRTAQVQMDVSAAIARLYNDEHDLEHQLETLLAAQVATDNGARLAREQRTAGSLDQLSLVEAEEALLSSEDATEATRLLELEKYTALEQAAGGAWSWVQ